MNNGISKKYIVFFAILVLGVIADQWTKWYASQRLATYQRGYIEHPLKLEVPKTSKPMTVREFLDRELAANSDDEIKNIAATEVRTPDNKWLDPSDELKPGQNIVVENRKVTVIDGYWDFEYTVNPGAAFGLLSDNDSGYRLPFFIVVSVLAIGIIVFLLVTLDPRQWLLTVSLSMIGTGAIGNFIDRIRFGHVIDFVVWKYTDQYRWPTFNVADAFISVGVALMLFEIIRGGDPPESEEDEDEPSET